MKTKILHISSLAIAHVSNHRLIWLVGTLIIAITAGAAASTVIYRSAQITKTANQPTSIYDDALRPSNTPNSSQPGTADSSKPSEDGSVAPNQSETKQGQTNAGSSTTTKPPTSIPGTSSTPKPSTPSPTPAPNPTPTPTLPPSGQAVPRNDFGAWKHIFYDDFTKDATLGSWGEDWDAEKIVYTGAQGQASIR